MSSSDEIAANLSYNDIARKLLNDRLLLTALELHYELVEAGKELPGLREFFSNPSNFEHTSPQNDNISITLSMGRSSSQATLDSLELTRYSEDGDKTINERIAVLEFELRKAKDTINALRANLTVAAVEPEEFNRENNNQKNEYDEPIKPHEQRVLNFLVNEYLMQNSYKLTSITFSDENENQDFEIWDDVGLNISRPPHLLSLYRDRAKCYLKKDEYCQSNIIDFANFSTQTEESYHDFNNKILMLKETNENLLSQVNLLKTNKISDNLSSIPKEKWLRIGKLPTKENSAKCELLTFYNTLIEKCWPDQQSVLLDLDVVLNTVMDTNIELNLYPLIKLLENQKICHYQNDDTSIDINKQEDFVLLSVLMMHIHPDENEKEKLLCSMLNLKKKPSKKERSSIIQGLSWFIKYSQNYFFDKIILPNFWILLNDKYVERRLLVAEGCSFFSPHITCELRQSLLSLLQQILIEDSDETVRAAAIKSIAINAANIFNSDKYTQVEELLFIGLKDVCKDNFEITINTLLPVLAKWAFDSERLQSHCFTRLINSLISLIEALESQKNIQKVELLERNCCAMVHAIRSILPYMVLYVASAPECLSLKKDHMSRGELSFSDLCVGLCDPTIFFSNPDYKIGIVMCIFDMAVENIDKTWTRLQWLLEFMLPKMIDMAFLVSISNKKLLQSLKFLFQSFCCGFGSKFTLSRVKPLFTKKIQELEKLFANVNESLPSLSIIFLYLYTVLAPIQSEETELESLLKKYVCMLPLCGVPIDVLHTTVFELASNHSHLHNIILSSLWEGVISQKESVRLAVTKLLSSIIPCLSDINITNRVVPALITLSNDCNSDVKIALVPVIGELMTSTNNKDTIEKCRFQMKSLMEDRSLNDNNAFATELITAFGKMAPKSDQLYREEVIMVQLNMYSGVAVRINDISRKIHLTKVLLDAFSSILYECTLSQSAITSSLLPSLRCLEDLCIKINLPQKELSILLIKEAESKLANNLENGNSSGLNVTQDLKPKMVKMFQSSNIAKQTMFWKKSNSTQ
ncbi:RAB11-binding protein RELCH-like isoform X2 [Daktulosphaira vitifoliae]|uniref:RAB11-binding protein RELCH-like isoform X2 n=1 Tax=Daktulosphaira vitifoliae TaxID=58002 RepID=UPI0021AA908F|nr:RAB11-binding protein RELCH-like isoform X2 [Daktulosphaira vitifoliae]